MYYNTTKPQYRAAPTTANNSALLYGTAARPTASLSSACTKIYAEIFVKETSKGAALAKLAGSLGIQREEIACIGDGENDLSMFEAAGLRMAMGNGVPELKKKAEYILPSNSANGAAEGIYWYVLT